MCIVCLRKHQIHTQIRMRLFFQLSLLCCAVFADLLYYSTQNDYLTLSSPRMITHTIYQYTNAQIRFICMMVFFAWQALLVRVHHLCLLQWLNPYSIQPRVPFQFHFMAKHRFSTPRPNTLKPTHTYRHCVGSVRNTERRI